jgi:hypothetical protein
MHRTSAFVVLILAASIACAAPSLAPIPPSHPASPSAPEALLVPATNALAQGPEGEEPQAGREATPTPSGQHGGHHGH